jgi:hypothetical protein
MKNLAYTMTLDPGVGRASARYLDAASATITDDQCGLHHMSVRDNLVAITWLRQPHEVMH